VEAQLEHPGGRRAFLPALRETVCGSERPPHVLLPSHERQANAAKNAALYSTPAHKARRRRLEPIVQTGTVRCARGASCKLAELVDGVLVGGFIRGEWDLGHPDGESAGGPEHRACNRAAPMRHRRVRADLSTEEGGIW
jgi:hypothetical protein